MNINAKTINAKQFRQNFQAIGEKVKQGNIYTVIYRSRPMFNLVPLGQATSPEKDKGDFFESLKKVQKSIDIDRSKNSNSDKNELKRALLRKYEI